MYFAYSLGVGDELFAFAEHTVVHLDLIVPRWHREYSWLVRVGCVGVGQFFPACTVDLKICFDEWTPLGAAGTNLQIVFGFPDHRFGLGFCHFFGDDFDRFVECGGIFRREILSACGFGDTGKLPVCRSINIEAYDMCDEIDPFCLELPGGSTGVCITALTPIRDEDDRSLPLILAEGIGHLTQ